MIISELPRLITNKFPLFFNKSDEKRKENNFQIDQNYRPIAWTCMQNLARKKNGALEEKEAADRRNRVTFIHLTILSHLSPVISAAKIIASQVEWNLWL